MVDVTIRNASLDLAAAALEQHPSFRDYSVGLRAESQLIPVRIVCVSRADYPKVSFILSSNIYSSRLDLTVSQFPHYLKLFTNYFHNVLSSHLPQLWCDQHAGPDI